MPYYLAEDRTAKLFLHILGRNRGDTHVILKLPGGGTATVPKDHTFACPDDVVAYLIQKDTPEPTNALERMYGEYLGHEDILQKANGLHKSKLPTR